MFLLKGLAVFCYLDLSIKDQFLSLLINFGIALVICIRVKSKLSPVFSVWLRSFQKKR